MAKEKEKKKKPFLVEYYESKFIRGFVLKSAIFLGILFAVNLFIMLYFRHTAFFLQYLKIPELFYIPFLTGLSKGKLLNAFIFISVIFIVYIRKKIPKLKGFDVKMKQSFTFIFIAFIMLALQYLLKFWIKQNLDYAISISYVVTLLKYVLNILFVVLLAVGIYSWDFIKYFVRTFYKEISIFSIVFFAYWSLLELFQKTWLILSTIVAKCVGFLLGLSFNNVVVNYATPQGPQIGVQGFSPYVSAECSGIDSLQLYISLFVFLLALDWKSINKKKMLSIFLPGLFLTFLYNILRVYLIILVGVFISPTFAIDTFHTNIGWILFLAVFFVFWHFGSKYVYD
ncbi:archaeosortase/exosortase family protein [Candidatus Woesearchaeota archaeon]|nr:archaeosortase/exosortase family protein [Candidatus Woesearchaeota archaeon]